MENESLELGSENTYINDELDGLDDLKNSDNSSTLNNIFPLKDNLNHVVENTDNNSVLNNIFTKGNNLNSVYGVIKNHNSIPVSLREVSVMYSKSNISRILSVFSIAYVDVSSDIAKYGKRKPSFKKGEIERIVTSYSSVAQSLDEDAIARFISMCKEGTINSVVSYYEKKANARSKRSSDAVGKQNINFKFNVDKFRELHSGITPDDMTFDRTGDETYLVIDNYARVFSELYMLLVFYKVCKISQENELQFFRIFCNYIRLVLIAGMKMFMQLDLDCCYGELYEELKGFKPFNPNYLFVEDIPDKQQIHFYIKNSDFLTEAYRKEYDYAVAIPYKYDEPLKKDKHVDIEFCIMKGLQTNTAMIEVTISGQNPLGRIYNGETNPEAVVNFQNSYNYDFVTPNALMFLFRTILNYSKDEGRTSYYTELFNFLKQYEGSKKHNIVPKLLSVILPILHQRPNEEELKEILNKYFKTTDKLLRAEYRKLFEELNEVLKPKKIRVIDRFIKEIEKYVW